MQAQTVTFHAMAFEYQAVMTQLDLKPSKPNIETTADMNITFVVKHALWPLVLKNLTARKHAQAKRLLEDVIAKHAKTPWAALA